MANNEKQESSFIEVYSYDGEHHTLTVAMKGGKAYTYQKVPVEVYEAMTQAPSLGRFYGQYIRSKYAVLVEEREPGDEGPEDPNGTVRTDPERD